MITLPEGLDNRNNVCDEARKKFSEETSRAVNVKPSRSGVTVL